MQRSTTVEITIGYLTALYISIIKKSTTVEITIGYLTSYAFIIAIDLQQ